MPRLRALRTKEDIEKVPATEPVLIDVGEEPEAPKVEAQEETKAPQKETAPPKESDGESDNALQKRFEEQLQAEKLQREAVEHQLQDALRARNESESRLIQEQDRSFQSQYDAIIADLAAAQAEGDAAQQDFEAATSNGDYKAAAEANRRQNRAEARVERLEIEKAGTERRIEQKKNEPPPQTGSQFERAISNLPDTAKSWLRLRPSYITDTRKNVKLQNAHFDAIEAGNEQFTPPYYDYMEKALGLRQAAASEKEVAKDKDEEIAVVSAPPTREAPSMSDGRKPSTTRVTLTPEQREIAKMSGVDEITYARNLLKMQVAKKNGFIQ